MVERLQPYQEQHSSSLKDLMAAASVSPQLDAQIMRQRVQARRIAEDAAEESRRRRDALTAR